MIVIDTNALLLLVVGSIDKKLINSHKRTSIYNEQDYYDLLNIIGDFKNLIILPNVWTEVDNLLNNFKGERKFYYHNVITEIIKLSTEKHIYTIDAINTVPFFNLGVTDCLLLILAKQNSLLITSDSSLSDYAIANGIKVYDVVQRRNMRL